MEVIRLHQVVEKDGEIFVTGLPYRKGQHVGMMLWSEPPSMPSHPLTARQLLRSGLVGLWKDREDIQNSASYARQLREQAQRR